MTNKIGRPTTNPKSIRIVVRITEMQNEILNKFCIENKVNRMEAIRQGIELLPTKKK